MDRLGVGSLGLAMQRRQCHDAQVLRLLLIGLMGCGKSSVGKAVAAQRLLRYVDNDAEVAVLAGVPTLALAQRGGNELHRWEATYIRYLETIPGPFVAGLPASCADRPGELERLRSRHVIIYLRCGVQTLLERTKGDSPRPWLTAADAEAFTRDAFARRDPVFVEAAHGVVDADPPLREVTQDVLRWLSRNAM